MANFNWLFNDSEIETEEGITPAAIRKEYKRKQRAAIRKEKLSELFTELPQPGESLHIISNGNFDYFNFVPAIVEMLGDYTETFYGSTWTMSRGNVTDLFELYDAGKIGKIAILTGKYFKRRETAVYAALVEGLSDRKQRYVSFRNHAKVMLFNNGDNYIALEGSANFTANPRTEQTTIINDKELWSFHRQWMEEMLEITDGTNNES